MDNPNPIYYKDLVTPDDAITNLLDQLDALIAKYGEAKTKIQGEAAAVAKAMESVSSATDEQRKQIQLATEQSDKLVKAYRDVTTNQWKATQAFTEAAQAKKEAAQIDKLITQINTSAEGSYNRLSAQYRLNKIRLNEMSAAERAGTEAGRALEQETNAIYEEMKRLQEATGKHQLNVGNYADAAKGLRTELMSLTQQMAMMKLEGKDNSEEYRNMAARAGELKDAMADASEEVRHTADDTRGLNAVMGALVIGGTGLAVVTKAMGLFGESNEEAQRAEKGLGVVMAGVMGLTVVKNNLQKQSNLMVGLGTLQTKAGTIADKLREVQTKKSIIATKAATVAQKGFNAVASANPYVLLALALVTVVGALAAFALGADNAAKKQKGLSDIMKMDLDNDMEYAKEKARIHNERVEQLNRELEIAKARNASTSEIQVIEDKIYNERAKAHKVQMQYMSDEIAKEDEYRKKLQLVKDNLANLQWAKARGASDWKIDLNLDGKLEKVDIDKAIETVQSQVDAYGRAVEIVTTLKTEGADIEAERKAQLERRKQAAIQAAKTETDILRKSEDARIAIIADSYERERVALQKNAERQIEDIRTQLKNDANLTVKSRNALNAQIIAIETKLQKDLKAIRDEYRRMNLDAVRETEDIRIAMMDEGADKQRKELEESYAREMEDLLFAVTTRTDLTTTQVEEMYKQIELLAQQYAKKEEELENSIIVEQLKTQADAIELRLDAVAEGSQEEIDLRVALLEKQRQIELAENKQKAADVRQDEAAINAKYNAMILQQTTEMTTKRAELLLQSQQDLAQSEFDLLSKNERQKTQFQLAQEKARLQQILELNKTAGVKMSAEQVKTIENQIKAIEKVSKTTPFNNLYEVLGIGLNSEQQQAMSTVISETMNNISEMINMWVQEADAAIQAADKKVSAAQAALDAEIQARNEGYANNVIQAQKNLALEKQNQQKAIEEKKKAQKVQLALDTATQVSSLVTASANIWAGFTAIQPAPLGLALAIAGLATLWGSFAGAKAMAIAQATKSEQYADGTVELLQGGSHASGHDIDLGTKTDGTRRRAEGGEYFAVINKRNSRRFGSIIPDVINAFNDGTFAEKYQRANSDMAGVALAMVTGPNGTDVSALERGVDAIVKQGERTRFVDGDGNTVEVYKNVTTKILKS